MSDPSVESLSFSFSDDTSVASSGFSSSLLFRDTCSPVQKVGMIVSRTLL